MKKLLIVGLAILAFSALVLAAGLTTETQNAQEQLVEQTSLAPNCEFKLMTPVTIQLNPSNTWHWETLYCDEGWTPVNLIQKHQIINSPDDISVIEHFSYPDQNNSRAWVYYVGAMWYSSGGNRNLQEEIQLQCFKCKRFTAIAMPEN